MTPRSCAGARKELLRGVDRVSPSAARHLESCAECADFATRFATTRDGLRRHRARVLPDAGFAARVTAALPAADSGDEVSRAALRLLPAAIALTLVLGVWAWLGTSSPASLAETAPTDDVLAWVLENGSAE